ncbi:MAG: tRNA (cytidine(34)-2'-O)-methyltransferase [Rhodospirillaceae bacterium]
MRIALYQPDIPQNVGAIFRLGACFDIAIDIIEPCGFALSDSKLRRAGMDYMAQVKWHRYQSWENFLETRSAGRLVLMTTRGATALTDFTFAADDILIMGRESAGVPESVHAAITDRVVIPLAAGTRSLNMAMAAGIAAHEALRQTGGFHGILSALK